MSVVNSGIRVQARTFSSFEGTPTYGSQPIHPLDLRVSVNDAEVKKKFDYDGFERPFAMVPRKVGNEVVWERHALVHAGQSRGGYFGEQPVDEYKLPSQVKLDLDTVRQHGIAVGMDTNRGQVWTQESGKNHVVDWK